MRKDMQAGELEFPMGSCDCHVHIYGPFDQFPPKTMGKFAPSASFTVEELFALWDRHGIERGVIVHSPFAGDANLVTLDALRRFPKRLRGVAVIDEHISNATLDQLSEAGFIGARFNMMHAGADGLDNIRTSLDRLKSLSGRLLDRGWHVQLWVSAADLMNVSAELKKYPLTYVIDHQARIMTDRGVNDPGFKWFCERLNAGDFWCKLSGADRNSCDGAPYIDVDPFMNALVAANVDRLVWGSDAPHVGYMAERLPRIQDLKGALLRCVSDQTALQKILITNPARLYGFE